MEEIWKSIAEAIKLRATTAIVGSYFAFWVLVHWQIVYTSVFVSEEQIAQKFSMLKNEYINIYFMQPKWDDAWYYISILLPFALTYIWIWILPKYLFIRSFNVERDYKFSKRKRIIADQIELKKLEKRLTEESKDIAKNELEKARSELEATQKELEAAQNTLKTKEIFEQGTDSIEFEERKYQEFMKRADAKEVLKDISECVYGNFGLIQRTDEYERVTHQLDSDSLAVADTNRIITIAPDRRSIELTDLGRYFLSKQ